MKNYLFGKRVSERHFFVAVFISFFFISFCSYAQTEKVKFATIIFTSPLAGKSKIIKCNDGKIEKLTLEKQYDISDIYGKYISIIDEQLTLMDSLGFKLITMSTFTDHAGGLNSIYTFRKQ